MFLFVLVPIKRNTTHRSKSYRDDAGIKRVGQKIREIRISKGITQEELEKRSGFDLSQIGRIERGVINTSISHLFKNSGMFGSRTSRVITPVERNKKWKAKLRECLRFFFLE